ncbi:MAG: lysine 5,6-aminomutase reactivase subunit KamB [Clostridia bacterium]
MSRTQLIDLIYPQNKIVSIVGTSKNAGKTVTLNEIISQAGSKGVRLGLISTGRDGERKDVLTNTAKPPIFVGRGTILTTVEGAIKGEHAGIEIFRVTDYNTPMGRVVLGRATEDGYVEISGPHSSATIKEMCIEMQGLGAELILIDGSLDRRASAAPYVSDGTVVATGAALARNINGVVEKTMHLINTYSVSIIEEEYVRDIAYNAVDMGKTAVIAEDGSVDYLDTMTSLQSGDIISEYLEEDTAYVVLSGSATVGTVKDILLNRKSPVKIIVKDSTRIFIPAAEFHIFQRMGMELRVVENINIIAVTVNPYSTEGYYLEPMELLDTMRNAVPHIPVFDVVQGE